jgi:hypothetical protein
LVSDGLEHVKQCRTAGERHRLRKRPALMIGGKLQLPSSAMEARENSANDGQLEI